MQSVGGGRTKNVAAVWHFTMQLSILTGLWSVVIRFTTPTYRTLEEIERPSLLTNQVHFFCQKLRCSTHELLAMWSHRQDKNKGNNG